MRPAINSQWNYRGERVTVVPTGSRVPPDEVNVQRRSGSCQSVRVDMLEPLSAATVLTAQPPVTGQRTVTEWGTLDRWYDDPNVESYGTEDERADGQDYARLTAERYGHDVVVMRREVTEWVEADAQPSAGCDCASDMAPQALARLELDATRAASPGDGRG